MKILKTLSEEIVPLSRRQNIVLLVIIACIFQFVLFYAPALADEAVKQTKAAAKVQAEDMISLESMLKTSEMDQEAAKVSQSEEITSDIISIEETDDIPPIKIIRVSKHVITAYNSEAGQTDNSPCITANNFNVCKHGVEDTIAANFLKFGTKVKIPELFGDRVFIVRDRMNKKHPDRVDIWMKDYNSAIKFGKRVATIQVIE